MLPPDQHDERARRDAVRTLLAILAAGFSAMTYAASTQTGSQTLWFLAAGAFGISLLLVVWSWFLVKQRAIARRDNPGVKFPKRRREASWYWDMAAGVALIVGFALLAVAVAFFPKT